MTTGVAPAADSIDSNHLTQIAVGFVVGPTHWLRPSTSAAAAVMID